MVSGSLIGFPGIELNDISQRFPLGVEFDRAAPLIAQICSFDLVSRPVDFVAGFRSRFHRPAAELIAGKRISAVRDRYRLIILVHLRIHGSAQLGARSSGFVPVIGKLVLIPEGVELDSVFVPFQVVSGLCIAASTLIAGHLEMAVCVCPDCFPGCHSLAERAIRIQQGIVPLRIDRIVLGSKGFFADGFRFIDDR